MSNIVKHGVWTIEKALEERKSMTTKDDFMKLEVGRNVVRFLPTASPEVNGGSPFFMVYQHFINVPGQDTPAIFPCPWRMEKRSCPACNYANMLQRSGNPADARRARDFFPSQRIFANVIDRSNPEAGPRILGFGKTIYEELVNLRVDEDAGGDFTDPDTGFDIIITREGTGRMDTRYTVNASRSQGPIEDESWIYDQQDLERFTKVPSDDEIQAKLEGAFAGLAVGMRGGGSSPSKSLESPTTIDDDDIAY